MDHQAFAQLLGNYGEFVGAIAVVVTLGYLAVQIRQSTATEQATAFREWYAEWRQILSSFSADDRTTQTMRKGFTDFGSLSKSEQAVFHTTVAAALNHAQMTHELCARGMLPTDTSEICDDLILSMIQSPGGAKLWEIIALGYRGFDRLQRILDSQGSNLPPWNEALPWWSSGE